jgi:hypothetical protein
MKMGVFEQFPYTNFHELNLDWVLNTIKTMQTEFRDFISQNSIKYADPIQWDITKQYERNTVVVDITGNGYLSVKAVPGGISIDRTEYWTIIGNFSALWGGVKNSITLEDEGHSTAATKARVIGDLVWLNNDLIEVTANMSEGTVYVIGTNCRIYSMQILLKELESAIVNEATARANADIALGLDIDAEVTARANADIALGLDIDAEVTARANADIALGLDIDAEVTARANADIALGLDIDAEATARANADTALGLEIDAEATARMQSIEDLQEEISALNVGDYVNPSKFGAIGNGIADDRQALQDAVNYAALNGKIVSLTKGCTYLIASLNPTDYYNLVTIKPNTRIYGNGATIKLANHMQALDPQVGSPYTYAYNNIMGTVDIDIDTVNKGIIELRDLIVNLNGQNNLLVSPETKNNCALFVTLFDACIITNCVFQNANGNQVLMLMRGNVGSRVIYKGNLVDTVADTIVGNYSFDHSSLYVQCTSVFVSDNVFRNPSVGVNSAAIELHCVYIWCNENLIYKYTHGVYAVAEYYNISENRLEYCEVGNNTFQYTQTAFAPWTITTNGASATIGVIKFHDNYTYCESGDNMILADSSVLMSGQCEILEIENNVFKFSGGGSGIMANNKVTKICVKGNKFINTHNIVGYFLCSEIYFEDNDIIDASIASNNTFPIWIEGATNYLSICNNTIRQTSAYVTAVFNIIASIANGIIKDNNMIGFTRHFNYGSNGILTTNKCLVIHRADIDLTGEIYGSSGSEFTLTTTNDTYILTASTFGKVWLLDAKNFTSYFDHTKLPYDFGIGTFSSFVNGDTTTPTTQGLLIVQKYNTNTAYNKWIKSFFYPDNNPDTFYISSGVDGSNAWSAWAQYNKV